MSSDIEILAEKMRLTHRLKKHIEGIGTVLLFTFAIALFGLWDFLDAPDKPFAIPPFAAVALMLLSAYGLYRLVRLQIATDRLCQ